MSIVDCGCFKLCQASIEPHQTIQMKERIANSLIWLREWKNMAVKLLAWGVKRNFLLRLHYDLCRTSYIQYQILLRKCESEVNLIC